MGNLMTPAKQNPSCETGSGPHQVQIPEWRSTSWDVVEVKLESHRTLHRKNLKRPPFELLLLPRMFIENGKDTWFYTGISKNNGTPKSSILIGFSLINHPFWGTLIFGNTHTIFSNNQKRKTPKPNSPASHTKATHQSKESFANIFARGHAQMSQFTTVKNTESLIGKMDGKMKNDEKTSTNRPVDGQKSSWAGPSHDSGSWSHYCSPTFVQPCQRLVACPSTGYLFPDPKGCHWEHLHDQSPSTCCCRNCQQKMDNWWLRTPWK